MPIQPTRSRSIPRFAWVLLAASLLLGAFAFWRLAATRPPTYQPEEVSVDKPILAVQGLPGGAHYPISMGQGAAPGLDISPAYYDFGVIPADRQVEHTFVIRNRGAADLRIYRAYTTCEYTRAQFSATIIPPGKVALVTVRYDPQLHAVSGSTLRRGVVIESNDPDNLQSEIWVQVKIK